MIANTGRRALVVVDMFCGAGGITTGLTQACKELGIQPKIIAINHWNVAIETHKRNHPEATHWCERVDSLDPRKLTPDGRIDFLIAAPECTHHSVARGGKPINDQSRASAWQVVRYAEALSPRHILLENVREFTNWGPLCANNKRPLKSRRGQTFAAFLGALGSLGYIVEWKLLNAADYGEATTRERLFIQAKRGRGAIAWPEPTHSKDAASQSDLFRSDLKPWRPAREIIDWSLESQSIFDRKKPLASATIRRIEAGLRKFGGKRAEPFLVILRNHADAKSVDEPMPTLTAGGSHFGLCESFVLGQQSGSAPRSTADPLPTVSTDGAIALVESFIVSPSHGDNGMDGRCRSIDQPLPTVTGSNNHAVVEPFLVPFFGEREGQDPRTHSISEPLPTITSRGAGALVQPFIMPVNHGTDDTRTHSIDEPMPTVTTVDAWSVVDTCLVKYNGTADSVSIDEPLDTITAKDRFGLVTTTEKRDDGESQNYRCDIRFRMLRPCELAAAMGFEQYEFTGNREQRSSKLGTRSAFVRLVRFAWLSCRAS